MTALPSETKPKTISLGISSDLEHLNCQSRRPTLFQAGMKSSEGRDGLWCLRTLAAVSRAGTRRGHSNRAGGQVLLDRHTGDAPDDAACHLKKLWKALDVSLVHTGNFLSCFFVVCGVCMHLHMCACMPASVRGQRWPQCLFSNCFFTLFF